MADDNGQARNSVSYQQAVNKHIIIIMNVKFLISLGFFVQSKILQNLPTHITLPCIENGSTSSPIRSSVLGG